MDSQAQTQTQLSFTNMSQTQQPPSAPPALSVTSIVNAGGIPSLGVNTTKEKTVRVTDDGKDRHWKSFNPMSDIIFGKVEELKYTDKTSGQEGVYWVIKPQRKYPNGSTGRCQLAHPKARATRGIQVYDETKAAAKKEAAGGATQVNMMKNMQQQMSMQHMGMMPHMNGMQNMGMNGMQHMGMPHMNGMNGMNGMNQPQQPNPNSKPAQEKLSVNVQYDPYNNQDHKEYLDKIDELYRAVLLHLSTPAVRTTTGIKFQLDSPEEVAKYSKDRQDSACKYPVFYPIDKSTAKIMAGAAPSTFLPVYGEGLAPSIFLRHNKEGNPISVSYKILKTCSFDFEGIVDFAKIVINGKGPTAGMTILLKEALVSNPNPLTQDSHLLQATNAPEANQLFDSWNSSIADIMNTINEEKAEEEEKKRIAESLKSKPGQQDTPQGSSTSAGLAPVPKFNATATYAQPQQSFLVQNTTVDNAGAYATSTGGSGPFATVQPPQILPQTQTQIQPQMEIPLQTQQQMIPPQLPSMNTYISNSQMSPYQMPSAGLAYQ